MVNRSSVNNITMTNTALGSDNSIRALRFLEANRTFSALNTMELETLLSNITIVNLKRNQLLWEPEDVTDFVYLVRTGVIREYIPDTKGRPVTVGLHARQDIIGLGTIMDAGQHSTVSIAHEDSVLYKISGEAVNELIKQNPQIGAAVSKVVFERMKNSQHRIPDLINKTAHSRLAAMLLSLAEKFGIRDSRGVIINLKLTHRVIASLIGTTRETVSFAIVDLRGAGLIQNDGKRFIITETDALLELAESVETLRVAQEIAGH